MFPVIEYTYQELKGLLKNAKEISQKDNLNANAKLFILENDIVFKMYIPESDDYLRNIKNLLILKKCYALKSIEEIVLPVELIKLEDKIIGYFMPYIKGKTMASFLYDPVITNKHKVEAFSKLASVINNLPRDIFIGDLHIENVLICSNYDIRLIDIDGFSIEYGEKLTVPTPLPNIIGKYYDYFGNPVISRNSDIFCVYRIFMQWIGNGLNILESEYREMYFSFLSSIKESETLLYELSTLYNDRRDNVISTKAFLMPSIDSITLEKFMKKSKIKEHNETASIRLEYLWRRIR